MRHFRVATPNRKNDQAFVQKSKFVFLVLKKGIFVSLLGVATLKCLRHLAWALRGNPQGGGTHFGMKCHKGTPFDHVLSMISTNQNPEFLALGQCEALILQHFMSTPNTLANQAIRRNIQGGGTQQKLQSLKLSLHRYVRTTGQGHSIGITTPKASPSEICENHGAGALSWNPQGGGTQLELQSLKLPPQRSVRTMGRGHSTGIHGGIQFGMRYHKGTNFDHVSLMISTNQKLGFLALGQWEALILQQFMPTFHTKALLTDL